MEKMAKVIKGEVLKIRIKQFRAALINLGIAWDEYDKKIEFDSYPFSKNFNEVVKDVKEWEDEINSL